MEILNSVGEHADTALMTATAVVIVWIIVEAIKDRRNE